MNLSTKQKLSYRFRKQNYGVRGGRDKLGDWDWYIHTKYLLLIMIGLIIVKGWFHVQWLCQIMEIEMA